MRRRRNDVRLIVMVLAVWVAAVAAAQSDGKLTSDEAAVRDLVQRYVDAREKRDATALAALFTADADQFTTGGEWRKGREGVVQGGLASSQRNPGTRRITVRTVRFITPNVAVADGGYSISAADGAARPMWTTIVATLTPEGWRIAAIRNALPARLPQ
jgi:uncharacterized protein (TIGR02246 family)